MVLPYPCCLSPVSVTFRGSDVTKHEINSLFVVLINLALAYLLVCDYLLQFRLFLSLCDNLITQNAVSGWTQVCGHLPGEL